MGDESAKPSSNIIILQQIEDCRDRNDTVLQFTVDPITFGYPSNPSSSSSATGLVPTYSINDLKNLLDDELIKNFSLTSTTNELIFSAVNCSLLLCMRVLTSLRKKSWIILTSNAYLDIYTNCIVKTFYFEKYTQAKIFAAASPTAANAQATPAFAPRSNLIQPKRASAVGPNVKVDTDPLQPPTPPLESPSMSNGQSKLPVQQMVRRDSLRRQPPPPPASVKRTDSMSSDNGSTKKSPPTLSRTSMHSYSTNSINKELSDPEDSYRPAQVRSNQAPSSAASPMSSIQKQAVSSEAKSSSQSTSPFPNENSSPVKSSQNNVPTNGATDARQSPVIAEKHPLAEPEPETGPETVKNASPQTVPSAAATKTDHALSVESPKPPDSASDTTTVPSGEETPSFSAPMGKEDKFLFGSPLSLMTNFRSQSLPNVHQSSDSSSPGGAPVNKNAEYFRKLKEAQDADKQKQLEEESKMSAYELQKKREAEAEVQQHETSKTAHYARLGATFVNRGSPLVGAGRGQVPTGRLGGRGGNR